MAAFDITKYDNLFRAVIKLDTLDAARKFFEDICTVKELEAISQRIEVAKLLAEGKNYQDVSRITGASTATISRVSKCLRYGSGGYRLALDKMKQEEGQA